MSEKKAKIRYSKDALILAWDPDFTKVTAEEAEEIRKAEESGYVDAEDIDWANIGIDDSV